MPPALLEFIIIIILAVWLAAVVWVAKAIWRELQ